MGDVVILDVETTLPIPPERVLEGAIKADLKDVLVVGKDKDGKLYVACSQAAYAEVILLLERAKLFCLRQID